MNDADIHLVPLVDMTDDALCRSAEFFRLISLAARNRQVRENAEAKCGRCEDELARRRVPIRDPLPIPDDLPGASALDEPFLPEPPAMTDADIDKAISARVFGYTPRYSGAYSFSRSRHNAMLVLDRLMTDGKIVGWSLSVAAASTACAEGAACVLGLPGCDARRDYVDGSGDTPARAICEAALALCPEVSNG